MTFFTTYGNEGIKEKFGDLNTSHTKNQFTRIRTNMDWQRKCHCKMAYDKDRYLHLKNLVQ